MENNIKYLTAKEARQISNEKLSLYKQECEIKANEFMETVMSLIEAAANNKVLNTLYVAKMDYQTGFYLCLKLRELGYAVSQGSSGKDRCSFDISW